MKKLLGLTSGILMIVSSASPALAFNWSFKIRNNGSDSDNKIELKYQNLRQTIQSNLSSVVTEIDVESETGENKIEDTTGGEEVSIKSGDVLTGIVIQNDGNTNTVEDDCGCVEPGDADVEIKGNGTDSDNDVKLDVKTHVEKLQESLSERISAIKLELETGENKIDDSTGGEDGDPSIKSGNIETVIDIHNGGDENTLN